MPKRTKEAMPLVQRAKQAANKSSCSCYHLHGDPMKHEPDCLFRILAELVGEVEHYERWATNIAQDGFEGCWVEVSHVDAARQALAEVSPDHPVLKCRPPSFGVWEAQRLHIEKLEAAIGKAILKKAWPADMPAPTERVRQIAMGASE